MKISADHVAALENLGYTTDEARFLYIAATHSGYFLPRQFLGFAGVKWGKRSDRFATKLESRGHASWREYPYLGGVYHLSSKDLYRRIDREDRRNWRRHSTEFIRTRLVLLDFVLTNQTHLYLETEEEKKAYFGEQLGVPMDALPAKAYGHSDRAEPAVRYFVDKFPLFLDGAGGTDDSNVTFSYVDSGEATLRGLVHHLAKYSRLFIHLRTFRFLYISNSPMHFVHAEKCFSSFAKRLLGEGVPDDLSRYFRLRSAWELKRYGTLSNNDVEWLELAHRRFQGQDTEKRYAAWRLGQLANVALVRPLADVHEPRRFHFDTYLVAPGRTVAKDLGKTG